MTWRNKENKNCQLIENFVITYRRQSRNSFQFFFYLGIRKGWRETFMIAFDCLQRRYLFEQTFNKNLIHSRAGFIFVLYPITFFWNQYVQMPFSNTTEYFWSLLYPHWIWQLQTLARIIYCSFETEIGSEENLLLKYSDLNRFSFQAFYHHALWEMNDVERTLFSLSVSIKFVNVFRYSPHCVTGASQPSTLWCGWNTSA